MSEPLLVVDRLGVGYRNRAGERISVLRDVGLSVSGGESLGVVGESGAGKSTLVTAFLGYLRGGSELLDGQVVLDGHNLFSLDQKALGLLRGARVALVPQDAPQSLTPTMRIGALLDEALTLRGNLSAAGRRQRAEALLTSVALPSPATLLRRYPHELSGGQQQRVAIALALATDPDILVFDEPTTGLDVTTQVSLLDLLNTLRRRTGKAMIIVSHDLGAISAVSNRLLVMYAGEVVESGPTAAVLAGPRHPYTRALIAALPTIADPGIPQAAGGAAPSLSGAGCAFRARCPFATELCTIAHPALIPIDGTDGHAARCHHLDRVDQATAPARRRRQVAVQSEEPVLLQVTDLALSYARPASRLRPWETTPPPATVSGVSFAIRRGQTLALVGESGSGKSTIVRAIAGLLPPRHGEVAFAGQPLPGESRARPADLKRRIQLIFQNPDASLNPRQTIAEALAQPLRLYFSLDRAQCQARSIALLESVRLDERYLTRYPLQLSGGERQRVAIARAFAAEPDLVLCDEVTSSLDVSVQASVLDLLVNLQRDHGVSYLFVSHNLAVVRALADDVIVLFQGRVCEAGPVAAVFTPPHHPYTAALLAAVIEPGRDFPAAGARTVPGATVPTRGCRFHQRCPYAIARLCAEVDPPPQATRDGRLIYCHLPLETLERLPSEPSGFGQVTNCELEEQV